MTSTNIALADFFVLRTPLLPWSTFKKWGEGNREHQRAYLKAIVQRDDVREALFLASESLFATIPHWLESPDSDNGIKTERSLVRYFSRLCGRATPFGLFAGCSLGRISDITSLHVKDRSTWRRAVRLDMEYIGRLTRFAADNESILRQCLFYPNTTLYKAGPEYRWTEICALKQGGSRSPRVASVEGDEILEAVLASSRDGATWQALNELIKSNAEDSSDEERDDYLRQLISSQFLIADNTPPLTGGTPSVWMQKKLEAMSELDPDGSRIVTTLTSLNPLLAAVDAKVGVGSLEVYDSIFETLNDMPIAGGSPKDIQVDLHKPSDATFSRRELSDLLTHFPRVWNIFALESSALLRDFVTKFESRFGDRTVPLLQVMDPDSGLGFGAKTFPQAPLVNGLGVVGVPEGQAQRVNLLDHFLEEGVRRCLVNNEVEWRWEIDDLQQMEALKFEGRTPEPRFPFSILLRAALFSHQTTDTHQERLLKIEQATGPSSARLLTRFANGNPDLLAAVLNETAAEADLANGALIAEIVHQPGERVGNVLLHPSVRAYEIPILANSSASRSHQIDLADLRVCIRFGKIRLYSDSLRREIIPRNSTAHNFALPSNIPIYRFLSELQIHNTPSNMGWVFSRIAKHPRLPRVRLGQMILSPAMWYLNEAEIAQIKRSKDPLSSLIKWLQAAQLPRFFGVVHDDSALPIDQQNNLTLESLIQHVLTRRNVTFAELWPDGFEPTAYCEGETYAHELLIPLRSQTKHRALTKESFADCDSLLRFEPGSSWLYLKLYCGELEADRLLRDVLVPFANDALYSGQCTEWFFLRYQDPEHHIRIRFHGHGETLLALYPKLLSRAQSYLGANLWRVSLDTYDREVVRYGGINAIPIAEKLFGIDSRMVGAVLTKRPTEEQRWLTALYTLKIYLDIAGVKENRATTWLTSQRDSFQSEFELSKSQLKVLGQRFRDHTATIESLLSNSSSDPFFTSLQSDFDNMKTAVEEQWRHLKDLESRTLLSCSTEDILRSICHMHANRIFCTAQRAQEMVSYDFLLRWNRRDVGRHLTQQT